MLAYGSGTGPGSTLCQWRYWRHRYYIFAKLSGGEEPAGKACGIRVVHRNREDEKKPSEFFAVGGVYQNLEVGRGSSEPRRREESIRILAVFSCWLFEKSRHT